MEKKERVFEGLQRIERSLIKRFRKELWRPFVRAIQEFDMIQPNDRIAVCISGGKDSMLLAKMFQELKAHGKDNFSLVFLVMDPGYNEANLAKIVANAELLNIPITIRKADIFEAAEKSPKTPCYLCARMRRGYLYRFAKEENCNKIALGHHYDDMIETVLLSLFYGAEFKTMLPKIRSRNFEGMELIRPLYFIRECDILAWCRYNSLEFINCACKVSERDHIDGKGSKRQEIKSLLAELRKISPLIDQNIFKSTYNVNLSTILGYHDEHTTHFFLDTYASSTQDEDE